jgi:hypothetical protein
MVEIVFCPYYSFKSIDSTHLYMNPTKNSKDFGYEKAIFKPTSQRKTHSTSRSLVRLKWPSNSEPQ